MKIAVYPGSFDPITLGHLNLIKRASRIFDKVYVCVMVNSGKHPWFTLEERMEFIQRCVERFGNVEVEYSDKLLVEYAKSRGATVIVKGLRAVSDFEYEFQMALTNKKLNPDVETVFLTTSAEYMYLSSSIVKQVASFGGDISGFVARETLQQIKERLCKGGAR